MSEASQSLGSFKAVNAVLGGSRGQAERETPVSSGPQVGSLTSAFQEMRSYGQLEDRIWAVVGFVVFVILALSVLS